MLEVTRRWRPGRAVDLHATLGTLRRGAGDPAYKMRSGAVWRASRTPDGPGTLRLAVDRGAGAVLATAWGPGADWLIDSVPALLGAGDRPEDFVPYHAIVREAARRHAGWRVPRTGLVMEALVPAILEQKVAGAEARRSWRELLWRFGEPAPGPRDGVPSRMRVPPQARDWRLIPSWEWHRAGVDGSRVRAIHAAAAIAGRLEATAAQPHAEAERVLRLIPGVGVWTAAEVRQRAHGDPDAVSVGDYHLAGLVGWALVGRKVDDAQMLELLAPYAGQRYRAIRFIELSEVGPPRRGPRLPLRNYRRL